MTKFGKGRCDECGEREYENADGNLWCPNCEESETVFNDRIEVSEEYVTYNVPEDVDQAMEDYRRDPMVHEVVNEALHIALTFEKNKFTVPGFLYHKRGSIIQMNRELVMDIEA